MSASFGARLAAEFAAGRHLCAGIDPHAQLLDEWGLDDGAAGAERMGRDVVAAAAGVAACVKPQVAFFERHGSAGLAALERVVADAKRGDIGSSFAAYADAWLAPGSPLESDAVTVAAYQGFGTLAGALGHVREHGKGLFVLAATSNPEAREVQTARREDGRTVAAAMVDDAADFDRAEFPGETVGSVGVVLGATLRLADFGIVTSTAGSAGPAVPILAPGFGHQGARIEDAPQIFGSLGRAILANESRSILAGGSRGLGERIAARAAAIAEALH